MPCKSTSRALPIFWHITLCVVYGIMLALVIVMTGVPAFRLIDGLWDESWHLVNFYGWDWDHIYSNMSWLSARLSCFKMLKECHHLQSTELKFITYISITSIQVFVSIGPENSSQEITPFHSYLASTRFALEQIHNNSSTTTHCLRWELTSCQLHAWAHKTYEVLNWN